MQFGTLLALIVALLGLAMQWAKLDRYERRRFRSVTVRSFSLAFWMVFAAYLAWYNAMALLSHEQFDWVNRALLALLDAEAFGFVVLWVVGKKIDIQTAGLRDRIAALEAARAVGSTTGPKEPR